MSTQTITALYDTQAEAERAVEALAAQGIPRSDLRIHRDTSQATSDASVENQDKGFWASLADVFVPVDDRYTYAEALRRGSVMVSARVDEAHYEAAADLLETHGAVDIDARETGWRSEGWTGGAGIGQTGTGTGGHVGAGTSIGEETGLASGDQGKPGTMLSRGVDEVAGTNISGAHPEHDAAMAAADRSDSGIRTQNLAGAATGVEGTEAIPVVEETLRVGKRAVSGGRVRVRSYVVETPVEEQVTLRTETVDVERRAVDRPVTDADRLFQDRTIEATETSEEAVVAKEARVTEEVLLRKEAEERTETVRDTVRRTDVEVDRDADTTKPRPV